MTQAEAKKMLDSIVGQIFGYQNPLTMEQFMQKFTFDIRLPQEVIDSTDGSKTWASSTNPTRFVKLENARDSENNAKPGEAASYLRPSRPLANLQDMLAAWNEVNLTTAERYKESINVAESDTIHYSENVFRSQDITKSRNVIFSDGIQNSEFMAASQRSQACSFGIRIEDSGEITNSFNVSWSMKITNCLFIHDCADMQDSMFCTNISGERFCIANMQYTEQEYRRLRDEVVRWILSPA